METTIILSGMKFYGFHGCFEEEQTIGTHFIVDMELVCHTDKAAETDDINNAVNYVSIYHIVKKVMDTPTHLLETLADRIIKNVKKEFPLIAEVKVKVCKLNPPLDSQTDYVAVQMKG